MPRPTRIEFPGALYYISAQSIPEHTLFSDDIDRRKLLEIMDAAIKRYHLLLHSYVLLEDGYRLMVETPQANLTKAMQYINSHFTAYTNTRRTQAKQIFKGRYLSTVVEKPRYLLKLCRFVHLMPVNQGLVSHPDQYAWSSHAQYVIANNQIPAVHTEDVLSSFGGTSRRQRKRYQQFIQAGLNSDSATLVILLKKTRILGSAVFAAGIKSNNNKNKIKQIEPKTIIDRTALFYDINVETILNNRTKPNPARNTAIYLCRNMTDMPLEKLGSLFGVGPSSICNTAKRVEAHKKTDTDLLKSIDTVEEQVKKASE
ncbi:MAG TPA: helix-turn-helix domain-containing protein [bacterium]|nr:helix-turn-helix domain-containing protein [bacterium]